MSSKSGSQWMGSARRRYGRESIDGVGILRLSERWTIIGICFPRCKGPSSIPTLGRVSGIEPWEEDGEDRASMGPGRGGICYELRAGRV
jgi:hypothetical protein